MAANGWFYAQDDRQHGPVTAEALCGLLAGGGVPRDALVWREGLAEWVPASAVAELSAGVGTPAAAPGPAAAASPTAVIAYQQPAVRSLQFTPRAMEMLRATAPWARLIAVLLFIFSGLAMLGGVAMVATAGLSGARRGVNAGFLMAMSLGYLLFGLLYFIPAFYLNRYASRIGQLRTYAREDVLESTLEAQKSFWKFCGIATLIVVGLYLLLIVGAMVIAVLA